MTETMPGMLETGYEIRTVLKQLSALGKFKAAIFMCVLNSAEDGLEAMTGFQALPLEDQSDVIDIGISTMQSAIEIISTRNRAGNDRALGNDPASLASGKE